MEDINHEISKRKKVRKTLLLKVNDEIKEISDSKPKLLINSTTIQDIEKKYNRNNILLSEKGIIYSNYVKTETRIYPPIINHANRYKSAEKQINNKPKTNIELIIGSTPEEDIVSPILNFLPKKIDLGSKILTINDKRHTKNIENVPKIIENDLNSDSTVTKEEDKLNNSTKIEKNKNLNKLIEKILSKKNNEKMEKIIKKNIKKLRKYCYKFRKKKNKDKIHKSQEPKNNVHNTSKNLSVKKNEAEKEKEKESKLSNFKMAKHSSSKKPKHFLSVINKRKPLKLKTINDDDGKKFVIQLHKMKISKSIKTLEQGDGNVNDIKKNENSIDNENSNDEIIPDINHMKKKFMNSVINKKSSKFGIKSIEKDKTKNNIKLKNRKNCNRKTSLFFGKEIEKVHFSFKKDKKDKNDRNELNDKLVNRSKKKLKKGRIYESKSNKNINLKIKNINLYPKRKSQKKIIESSGNKMDDYSNYNTNCYTNIINLTQSTNEKNSTIDRDTNKNKE